jgi:hypothetical protein
MEPCDHRDLIMVQPCSFRSRPSSWPPHSAYSAPPAPANAPRLERVRSSVKRSSARTWAMEQSINERTVELERERLTAV